MQRRATTMTDKNGDLEQLQAAIPGLIVPWRAGNGAIQSPLCALRRKTASHADYIASWLEVLREDNRAIVRAASQASKAADFLLGFLPGDERASTDAELAAA
jgi:antirestriction protein ArdC